jgi:hypothetical protein
LQGCGEERYADIPGPTARSLQELLRPRPLWVITCDPAPQILASMSKSSTHGNPSTSTSSQAARASGMQGEKHTSTPDPNSGGTSSVPPPENATGSCSNATAVRPPQQVKEHVFLGAQRGMDYPVVDIEVQGLSDFRFFCALKQSYIGLRGNWRLWFSWWRFDHCEFFMVCLAFFLMRPYICCRW